MKIEERKKLKSRLLLAALYLQSLPVLCTGAVLTKLLTEPAWRNPEIFSRIVEHDAAGDDDVRLEAGDAVYERAGLWAKRAGFQLADVYMKKSFIFCNAFNVASENNIVIGFGGNPSDLPDRGSEILDNVTCHEITHGVRRCSIHIERIKANTKFLKYGAACYGIALVAGGGLTAAAGLAASLLAAYVSVPMMQNMFLRNEEYLADIGAVHMTGDVTGALITADYLEGVSKIEEALSDKPVRPGIFGDTHPPFESRRRVLCKAFNISTAQRDEAKQISKALFGAVADKLRSNPDIKIGNPR